MTCRHIVSVIYTDAVQSEFTLSVVGSCYLTLPQLNSHFLLPVTLFMLKLSLDETLHLSLQESYCLPVLTYAVAALSLSVRQENELNACWNSVYKKLFGFHKWESVKYCIYGLNRLDLHSIIRLRRAVFTGILCRQLARYCVIFSGVLSLILRLTMTFYLHLGCIAMW